MKYSADRELFTPAKQTCAQRQVQRLLYKTAYVNMYTKMIITYPSTVQYSTVQYSTVQYSTVQYSTVQYSTVQYSTVQYSTVQYSTVQYSAVQCSAVQCSAVQCSAVQCSAVQCSAVQCSVVQYSVNRNIYICLLYKTTHVHTDDHIMLLYKTSRTIHTTFYCTKQEVYTRTITTCYFVQHNASTDSHN